MKAIWSGSIGFGLVNIPIKLYSAVNNHNLDFDMLDKKDLSNIKFKRVNEKTGKEVLWENIVKGYMLDEKYVVIDKEDFEKAVPEKTNHIDIVQFSKAEEIDAVYYESPYYIKADKTGARAYGLLLEALEKTKKVGLGSFVMREREHICMIIPYNGVLVLNRLRYAAEIRDTDELKTTAAKNKPAEVKMAVSLIEQLTATYDPSIFKDEYTDKLLKIIKAKAKGKKTTYKPMKVVYSKTADLMEQLKASLDGKKKRV